MNTPQRFDLSMSRFICAPRETVFDAFVTCEAASAWICPRGTRILKASVDARPRQLHDH